MSFFPFEDEKADKKTSLTFLMWSPFHFNFEYLWSYYLLNVQPLHEGGGNSPGNYGQTNYGNGEVVGRQPQLTMHSHGQGNHAPNRPGFGPKQNRNRRGPGQPPKQVWVGLPKDEDEPK